MMQPPNQYGQCARHPERVAETVCPRCGNFTCPECNPDGKSLCPACMALGGESVETQPTPWERRGELGLVQGFFQTWKRSLFEPNTFWRSVSPDGPQLDAVLYAWLITSVTALLNIPMQWLSNETLKASIERLAGLGDQFRGLTKVLDLMGGAPLAVALGIAAFTIVIFPVGLIISAGLAYLGGMLFGASDKGFGATLRAIAYAHGPNIFTFIPVVGALAGIWTLVSEIWAIKDIQKTTGLRAAASVLWVVVLLCCCTAVGLGIFAAAMAAKSR